MISSDAVRSSALPETTSIGARLSNTVRSVLRVPVTMIVSSSSCACAGTATIAARPESMDVPKRSRLLLEVALFII